MVKYASGPAKVKLSLLFHDQVQGGLPSLSTAQSALEQAQQAREQLQRQEKQMAEMRETIAQLKDKLKANEDGGAPAAESMGGAMGPA